LGSKIGLKTPKKAQKGPKIVDLSLIRIGGVLKAKNSVFSLPS
jgi:hypothetical protein